MAGIPLITHKRGDTFEYANTIDSSFEDGYFVGWVVKSQIRDAFGVLYSNAECSWLDPLTTRFLLIKVTDTSSWPASAWPLRIDAQFVRPEDGFIISTDTQQITVIQDVTYGN